MKRPPVVEDDISSADQKNSAGHSGILGAAIRELRVLEFEFSEDALTLAFSGAMHTAQAIDELEQARLFLAKGDELMSRVFRISAWQNLQSAGKHLDGTPQRFMPGEQLVALEAYQAALQELALAVTQLELLDISGVADSLQKSAAFIKKSCQTLRNFRKVEEYQPRH